MSESPVPTFSIEKIYLKDLSVEVPNAPEVFLETEAPAMEVNINSAARSVQDGMFEVVLSVTITARIKEKTVFLVEVAQAGRLPDTQRAAAGHGAAAGDCVSEHAVSLRARNDLDRDFARRFPARAAGADEFREHLPAAASAVAGAAGFQTQLGHRLSLPRHR
jgi:hypothetical protein